MIMPKRKNGFTLVELLVVMAVLSVLASLLLPALHKGIESAYKIQCANQLKQTYVGFTYYLDDNRGYFPPHYYKFSTLTFAGVTRTGCYVPWYSNVFMGQYIGNTTVCSSAFSTYQQKVTSQVLKCPRYEKPKWDSIGYSGFGDFGFGYNSWIYKNWTTNKSTPIQSMKAPTKTLLLIDTALGYEIKHTYENPSADKWSRYWWPAFRHLNKANILFAGGNISSTYSLRADISSDIVIQKVP